MKARIEKRARHRAEVLDGTKVIAKIEIYETIADAHELGTGRRLRQLRIRCTPTLANHGTTDYIIEQEWLG